MELKHKWRMPNLSTGKRTGMMMIQKELRVDLIPQLQVNSALIYFMALEQQSLINSPIFTLILVIEFYAFCNKIRGATSFSW